MSEYFPPLVYTSTQAWAACCDPQIDPHWFTPSTAVACTSLSDDLRADREITDRLPTVTVCVCTYLFICSFIIVVLVMVIVCFTYVAKA